MFWLLVVIMAGVLLVTLVLLLQIVVARWVGRKNRRPGR